MSKLRGLATYVEDDKVRARIYNFATQCGYKFSYFSQLILFAIIEGIPSRFHKILAIIEHLNKLTDKEFERFYLEASKSSIEAALEATNDETKAA